MTRRLLLAFALIAAVTVGALTGQALTSGAPDRPFWAKIRYGAGVNDGDYLFDSVADITPGAADSGAFKAAEALIQGTIEDIEPGIAFASDDAESTVTVVPYDSEDAAMRYASLVVRVDAVLAGELGRGYTDGRIRLQIEHPATVTLAELKDSIGTAGTGLMYVHNLAERQALVGRPITDPTLLAYAGTVHVPIGEGLFVAESVGSPVIAPLMDPARAGDLLGYAAVPEDEVGVIDEPATTATCDDDGICPTPTKTTKPTDWATSVPLTEDEEPTAPSPTAAPVTEPTDAPTLADLRATLLAAACAEGTATDPTAC
ncbi:hypothetical protein EDD29_3217 [Actinocorallia herbida]|uniref:Uncharacterized protein n=1 Tax=Actinocorallia herbida TaxID=58109 RepID=A0A3N1CWJ9_9ACTN|nr:hypothetical protein [Actinocorallia herbida]ROO85670.1 hypothetical protein EDD29_3217 [Actinocorallia herbida]